MTIWTHAIALALMLAAGAGAARAGEGVGPAAFIGMWEGVDPLDGGLTQRSITCEGTRCTVLGADQVWTSCGGGRGRLTGTGTVDGKVLKVPDFTLDCEEGGELPVDTTFTHDPANGTLVERTANPNIPTITFHRISVPPSRDR